MACVSNPSPGVCARVWRKTGMGRRGFAQGIWRGLDAECFQVLTQTVQEVYLEIVDGAVGDDCFAISLIRVKGYPQGVTLTLLNCEVLRVVSLPLPTASPM